MSDLLADYGKKEKSLFSELAIFLKEDGSRSISIAAGYERTLVPKECLISSENIAHPHDESSDIFC